MQCIQGTYSTVSCATLTLRARFLGCPVISSASSSVFMMVLRFIGALGIGAGFGFFTLIAFLIDWLSVVAVVGGVLESSGSDESDESDAESSGLIAIDEDKEGCWVVWRWALLVRILRE